MLTTTVPSSRVESTRRELRAVGVEQQNIQQLESQIHVTVLEKRGYFEAEAGELMNLELL